jgi:TPR repeat protein
MAQERSLQAQASVRALPPSEKRWALLIGVDEYEDGNIGRLVGAANDARALKRVLVRSAGFPEDQVIVVATGDGRGSEPTRSNILERLSTVTQLAPKDGLLLFAFSGHGIDRKGRAFLLPSDAKMKDDPDLLEDLSVSVARVRQRIRGAGVQQVLVLLDACRNDPGGRSTAPNPLTEAFTRGFQFDVRNREVSAFATVYATKVGERAWEDQKNKRGYFSQAVEAALSGRAANERGEVTLAAMVSYLQTQVPKQVALAGSDRRQLPFAEVGGYKADELVLAVTQAAVRVPDAVQARLEIARSTWEEVRKSGNRKQIESFAREFSDTPYGSAARVVLEGTGTEPPVSAALNIESVYSQGRTLYDARQYAAARPLLRKAAEGGHRDAMFYLGRSYDSDVPGNSAIETDDTEAVSWYRKAAELGMPWAMNNLGKMYAHGQGGLKPDSATAVSWYRKALELGNEQAMNNLGSMYELGEGGLNRDNATAVSWYRKASELGSEVGMNNLGRMYELGEGGLNRDKATAVSWYRKAAELGSRAAMTNLGSMYERGDGGLNRDNATAVSWYRKAAELDEPEAMNALGTMYERGDGGLKLDQGVAISWYRKAAQKGFQAAKDNLRRLEFPF